MDFRTRTQKQLRERKEETRKLELELEKLHQTTLTPKLIGRSTKKGFIKDTDEAQVLVDFLAIVSFTLTTSLCAQNYQDGV